MRWAVARQAVPSVQQSVLALRHRSELEVPHRSELERPSLGPLLRLREGRVAELRLVEAPDRQPVERPQVELPLVKSPLLYTSSVAVFENAAPRVNVEAPVCVIALPMPVTVMAAVALLALEPAAMFPTETVEPLCTSSEPLLLAKPNAVSARRSPPSVALAPLTSSTPACHSLVVAVLATICDPTPSTLSETAVLVRPRCSAPPELSRPPALTFNMESVLPAPSHWKSPPVVNVEPPLTKRFAITIC